MSHRSHRSHCSRRSHRSSPAFTLQKTKLIVNQKSWKEGWLKNRIPMHSILLPPMSIVEPSVQKRSNLQTKISNSDRRDYEERRDLIKKSTFSQMRSMRVPLRKRSRHLVNRSRKRFERCRVHDVIWRNYARQRRFLHSKMVDQKWVDTTDAKILSSSREYAQGVRSSDVSIFALRVFQQIVYYSLTMLWCMLL